MPTIEERLRERLINNGLFDFQADEILSAVKSDPVNETMLGRWGDEATGHPVELMAVVWYNTKRHALAWTEKNFPMAWYRPLFQDTPKENP